MMTNSEIDVASLSCENRMEPRISKVFGGSAEKTCADTGADGRKNDLVGHLHVVNIGFQIRDTYLKQVLAHFWTTWTIW